MSRDAEFRREVYRRAETQLDLLRAIGISEMKKEIVKQVKSLENKITPPEPEPDEKVRDIIREVLDELYEK